MDPRTPATRLRGLLQHVEAPVCLTDEENLALAGEAVAGTTIRLAPSPAGARGTSGGPFAAPAWQDPPNPAGVAALGFTSGSTGQPKVVALNHQHLIGDAWAASSATGCIASEDVVAHTLPLAFAAGMNITLASALAGATLVLLDVRAAGIASLPSWIEQTAVTVLCVSPAIARALVSSRPDPRLLRTLRSVTLSGEAAYGRDVAALRALLPTACTVHQRLGSTETGLICELRLGPGTATPQGRLPVGEAFTATRVDLLDEQGTPVPAGQPGRLLITRSYLTTGYWRNPEQTAARYTDHPDGTRSFLGNDLGLLDADGRLCLLGRVDHSVKVRGYLVEPGEVDAVLHTLPDVAEAVTVGVPRPDGATSRLVAYVVSTAQKPSAAAIRAAVRAVLPGHLVPEVVIFCAALPRTERGKIDRSALPPPPPPSAGQPAIGEWERMVAQVWARALELDEVARDADFFELGGDSLAAEALITMVIEDLKVPPDGASVALLAEAPTVAQFAPRLHRRPDPTQQTLTTLRGEGSLTPMFIISGGGGLGVAFAPLARRLRPGRPLYALQAHAIERGGIPDWSARATSRRHLTTTRSLQPRGPYLLAGYSFGGLIAYDMAGQLVDHGHPVDLLVILDSFPPDPAQLPDRPPRSALGHVKDAVGLALTGIVPTPGLGHYWRFHRQSDFLARRYRPTAPYPGRTLILLSADDDRAARARWAPHLCGTWRMEEVGGDHYSMMREPHVSAIATLIDAELARIEQDDAAGTVARRPTRAHAP